MSAQRTKKTYHHGNLSHALVEQAIKLLEEEGIAALSLRRTAKEAGVSQAAPYAHFKNKKALLTAVANEGYSRFEKQMREEAAGSDDYIVGLGLGYVLFAMENPALFHLMFSGELSELIEIDSTHESFSSSYELLVIGLQKNPLLKFDNINRQLDTALMWSLVHGMANLLLAGRFTPENYGYETVRGFVEELLKRCIVPDEK